ncbi:unnamed protein product [Moneuplotes crassus]|uniref:Uncharacterized protein n=1 Tax=Euplotes crassus TaxID=5936 RepID=A0AAD1X5Z4_EUPCR|nr:unnamed protein product [Moneuplotes crassus]
MNSLITKFSHCSTILQFYGTFAICEKLLMRLSSKKRQMWIDNREAFLNCIGLKGVPKDTMDFCQEFNYEIEKFMLDNNRFINYDFIIRLSNSETLFQLISFLENKNYRQFGIESNKIPKNYAQFLRFKKVEILEESFSVEFVNQVYEALKKFNVNTKCLRYEMPFNFSPAKSAEKLEYVAQITGLYLANDFKRIGVLETREEVNHNTNRLFWL